MRLDCVLLTANHRWGKGSMCFVLSLVRRIAAATHEQRTRRHHQGSTRHGTLPGGGLALGEKCGIDEQAVTVAPVATLCTSGESVHDESGLGGNKWPMP